MLKKLLKYDLKNINKALIIFYLLSIFFAITTRILFNIDNSFIINIFAQISSSITISMIFNILINNIMRIWSRFRNNIYKDESYLTHTLPVTKQKIYLSKFLAIVITLFTSFLVILVTLFIAYYSKENLALIKNILLPITNIYNSSIIKILLIIYFVLFIEVTLLLQIGYSGLILGHKHNKNKLLYSIAYSFIIYIISQSINLLVIFIYGIFNTDFMNLFTTNTIPSYEILKIVLYLSIFLYISLNIIIYFVNIKLLKKGVNID